MPADANQLAKHIVDLSTEGEDLPPFMENEPTFAENLPTPKNPAAVALGKLGGSKGGKARAAKLSAKKRKEIAKKAANARWSKSGAKND